MHLRVILSQNEVEKSVCALEWAKMERKRAFAR